MEVSLPTDSNGYLSQECPSCQKQFKIMPGEGSEKPVSYCPYCRYSAENWFTEEQAEYIQAHIMKSLLGPLDKQLKKSSNSLFRVSLKSEIPNPGSPPLEVDSLFNGYQFPCCDKTVKLDQNDHYYCLICGEKFDMKTTEATKVFLSHKSVNKEMVIDYKKTLNEIGYDTWIDIDAMPAGTKLERGILNGMRDSCGVVFFITSSFMDEGYLASEIDYAIVEKRKKGDMFAIITLLIPDEHGGVGEVPELLRPYVYKQPKSKLEAIREIMRALPVKPIGVEWGEEIKGVVREVRMKPDSSNELSEKAKQLLIAAVAYRGEIMHSTFASGEEQLQAGQESFLNDFRDRSPRTKAEWNDAIKDLLRQGFIERNYRRQSNNHTEYKVTGAGFKKADEISQEDSLQQSA